VSRSAAWRTAVGVVVIGGILGGLWLTYRPEVRTAEPGAAAEPAAPLLHKTRARLVVHGAGSGVRRATIACDGRNRSATGFWARDPVQACDALAAARGPLLTGIGCRSTDPRRVRLEATGVLEGRRFMHRQQRGGCPDPEGWLAVNALAGPAVGVLEREATDVGGG
jgi:hypothetical protein